MPDKNPNAPARRTTRKSTPKPALTKAQADEVRRIIREELMSFSQQSQEVAAFAPLEGDAIARCWIAKGDNTKEFIDLKVS